ncbi:hypothetical protein E2C01_009009 [Portunus trituberculatus]|uniref:Uncharacterized protein n=1 Tax=Portunus trituberculatus TaxID=210409 RepID=A0A5B7D3T2_PORTR|nr:hypothetical protein [Portunus trituberculatus]
MTQADERQGRGEAAAGQRSVFRGQLRHENFYIFKSNFIKHSTSTSPPLLTPPQRHPLPHSSSITTNNPPIA